MAHENRNQVITLFYHEGTEREEKKILKHVQSCQSCQEYMHQLKKTESVLQQWQDERPLPNTLDLILAEIPEVQPQIIHKKQAITVLPFIHIVFSIFLIIAILNFIQSKFNLTSIWQSLQQYAIIQSIGSFGFVIVMFFLIGTFFTLAIFPTLFFDSQKKENSHTYV